MDSRTIMIRKEPTLRHVIKEKDLENLIQGDGIKLILDNTTRWTVYAGIDAKNGSLLNPESYCRFIEFPDREIPYAPLHVWGSKVDKLSFEGNGAIRLNHLYRNLESIERKSEDYALFGAIVKLLPR